MSMMSHEAYTYKFSNKPTLEGGNWPGVHKFGMIHKRFRNRRRN